MSQSTTPAPQKIGEPAAVVSATSTARHVDGPIPPMCSVTPDVYTAVVHSVPHRVVSQVLWGELAAPIPTDCVHVRSAGDARGAVSSLVVHSKTPTDATEAVAFASTLPYLTRLDLSHCPPPDHDTPWTTAAAQLRELVLKGCPNTPALLELCTTWTSALRVLDISDAGGSISAAALDCLAPMAELELLDISGCWSLQADALARVAALPALTSLRLSRCWKLESAMLEPIGGMRTLRALDLSKCEKLTAAVFPLIATLRGLTSLDIGLVPLDARAFETLGTLPHLETLGLSGSWSVSTESFRNIATQLPGIKSLDVSHCGQLNRLVIASISRLPCLEDLDVGSCWAVNEGTITPLAGVATLTRLCCRGCPHVGVDAIARLENLPLRTLDLSRCHRMGHDVLGAVARLPTLQWLSVADSNNVLPDGLAALSRSRSLTALDASRCPNVTVEGVAHLAAIPTLRVVTLQECRRVDGEALRLLRPAFQVIGAGSLR